MKINVIPINKSGDEAQSLMLFGLGDKEQHIHNDGIIPPKFERGEPYVLMEQSELFMQCIDAIAQSTCGYDYTLMLDDKIAPTTDEAKRTIDIIENISPNKSFIEILKQNVNDIMLFGYTGVEVLLSTDNTEFELMNIPVHQLRLCVRDKTATPFRINDKLRRWRFRRYAQVQEMDKVFFKELYDPRIINYTTGQPTKDASRQANPLLWIDNGNYTNHHYPQVLWQSVGYSALATGKVNELNHNYFKSGRIDTQVLLVAGGDYTEEEMKKIAELIEESKGIDKANSIIVIQSSPTLVSTNGGIEEKVSPVKLDMKPLSPPQSTDPQYLTYLNDCRQAVMSAFRVPPIVLGLSFDYNRATSEEATKTFYTKVVLPLQQKLENAYNNLLAYCGNPYRIRLNNPYREKY